MPHSLTTLQAILDDLRAPLQDIIGTKTRALSWAEKSPLTGGGKQVLQPVIVADDTGHGWITDGGNLAAAAGGDPLQLTVPYRFYAGRFRITGPTIDAAGEGNSQLENAVQFSMERLVAGVTSSLNRFTWSGNRTLGFFNEHENKIANRQWEFTGDAQKAADLITAVGGAITCDIIRLDTYATVATVEISAADVTGSRLTVDDALNTSTVGAGFACAVRCTEAGQGLENQMTGIYENIGAPNHFGQARTTVGGTALLQSNVLTLNTTGDHNRGDINLQRVQQLLDRISVRTRNEGRPTRAFFHPTARAEVATLFQGATTMQLNVGGGGGLKVDGGVMPGGFSYGGIPFEEDVDCARGGVFFVQDDTWSTYMMRGGDWDGDVYNFQGTDAVERVWKQYFNLGCYGPNFAGAIVGLDFDGALAGS